MIKKIGAVLLALVLCLSVAVLPVSAAGFADDYVMESGKNVAFKLEFDKANYSAGDTVKVDVYAKFADASAVIKSSYLTFGIDADVFDTSVPAYTNAILCEAGQACWKDVNSSAVWATVSNATILNKLNANKTEAEAFIDTYLRVELGKDATKGDQYSGLAVADLGNNPILSFTLKLKDDLAAGTKVQIAIPEASLTQIPAQTSVTHFKTPGTSTAGTAYARTTYISGGVTVAGIATASIINDGGSQIRFRGVGQGGTAADYTGEGFDVRTVATISEEDFAAKFTDDATAIASIAEIGFIYAAKSNVAAFDVETAKNAAKTLADKEALNGYVKKTVSHIQHVEGQPYKFTCLIDNIADADKTDAVSALAYIELTTGEYIWADAAIFADYTTLFGRLPK